MKALILVDIQIDFLPGGALEIEDGDAIIPVVNELVRHFPLIVATQDWHPATHKSFASNHRGKKPFEVIDLNGLKQMLWPDHCVQGSAGASFAAWLDMNKVEAVFRKGTDPQIDSYSAFFDNGHRKSTGLAGYLHEKGVDDIYICGLAGDICVYYTAMDGMRENFKTYIVEDACRPLSGSEFRRSLDTFRSAGGNVVDTNSIASTT